MSAGTSSRGDWTVRSVSQAGSASININPTTTQKPPGADFLRGLTPVSILPGGSQAVGWQRLNISLAILPPGQVSLPEAGDGDLHRPAFTS